MKKTSKILVLLLALVMVVGMTGCGKPADNTAGTQKSGGAASTEASADSKEDSSGYQTTYGSKTFDNVEISVEVFDRSNAPEGSTVTDNKWVDYINECMGKVGISVKFVAVPRSEEVSKVQLMMASSTAPDVMLCYTTAVVEGFFNDGGTYDLAPYIDGTDQAKNLKDYIGEACLDVARNANNELWGVPARRATTARGNLFIRKDWLDALGMDIPTTVEEMYHTLVAFKENNPEGRKDVIASSFSTCNSGYPFGVMAFAFMKGVADETTFKINNGSAADMIYTDDGFAEYFRWMNKLYNEGLMDTEYYVNNDFGQTVKEYFVNGQLGCFESDVNYNVDSLRGSLLQNLKASNPDAEFISIPPLKNINDGKIYNNGYPVNGAYVFVPKTCKNVEAAVTYMDWLATKDGGFTLFHGFEGEHFEYDAEGTPSIIDADFNKADKDWTRHDLFLVGNAGYYKTVEEFAKATAKEIPGYEDYVLENYKNATMGTVRNDTTFTATTFTEMNTEIGLARDEYFVKLITCAPDKFDETLNEFKAKLKDIGYDKIIEERTQHFK